MVRMVSLDAELLKLWWEELEGLEKAHVKHQALRDAKLVAKCGHGDEKACLALKLATTGIGLSLLGRQVAHLHHLVRYALDMAVIDFHAKRDREGLLKLLISLPVPVRRWYLSERGAPQRWCEEMLGELIEVLTKSRVELKLTLSEEEALRAATLWGSEWRNKLREKLREALRAELSV
jgi:hypothetical protein